MTEGDKFMSVGPACDPDGTLKARLDANTGK